MLEIIEYKVVYGEGKVALENAVNELIKLGWQPLSGTTIRTYTSHTPDLYQTMVKYAPPPKSNSI